MAQLDYLLDEVKQVPRDQIRELYTEIEQLLRDAFDQPRPFTRSAKGTRIYQGIPGTVITSEMVAATDDE